MIQIKAATRLLANADEQKARDFLSSVTGITVGKLEHSIPGVIRFTIDSPQDFMIARKSLTSRYGNMDTSGVNRGSHGGNWKIADKHHIALNDTRAHGKQSGSPYSITLLDDNHKESTRDMIRRIIGPPKNIPMK